MEVINEEMAKLHFLENHSSEFRYSFKVNLFLRIKEGRTSDDIMCLS